jgi:hypothetical protein
MTARADTTCNIGRCIIRRRFSLVFFICVSASSRFLLPARSTVHIPQARELVSEFMDVQAEHFQEPGNRLTQYLTTLAASSLGLLAAGFSASFCPLPPEARERSEVEWVHSSSSTSESMTIGAGGRVRCPMRRQCVGKCTSPLNTMHLRRAPFHASWVKGKVQMRQKSCARAHSPLRCCEYSCLFLGTFLSQLPCSLLV